ncbi:MAG: Fic family protein [Spirochaetales bacterium]|nr:Fic family protein [Spirochaetales bacterium]
MYIYEVHGWPDFVWNSKIENKLFSIKKLQGQILGEMSSVGFELRNQANLEVLTLDVVKSNEIEGEILDSDQVRSSVAHHLKLEISGFTEYDKNVDGAVEMLLDATQNYSQPLTKERLFDWHLKLFPEGRSNIQKIEVARWRRDLNGPMQVISGSMGKSKIHFQAPPASQIEDEISKFLDWFNNSNKIDLILKAAIAHLWFLTIHPFDDGNGRIARAIADMVLASSDEQRQRFYSISNQLLKTRKSYYDILEKTQGGNLDITDWLEWFLDCLEQSFKNSEQILEKIIIKHAFIFRISGIPLNSRQTKIIKLLLDDFKGILNTTKWAKICKTSQDTALRDINDLLSKGILEKLPQGGRSTSYKLKR